MNPSDERIRAAQVGAEVEASATGGARAPLMAVLDVSSLPSFGYGHRSLMWWSTVGLMLIEGSVFAIGLMM
jgi:hypothetical protein